MHSEYEVGTGGLIITDRRMEEMREMRKGSAKFGEAQFHRKASRQEMRQYHKQFQKMDFRQLYVALEHLYSDGFNDGYANGFISQVNHLMELLGEVLHEEYGFGEKRMKRVQDAMEAKIMELSKQIKVPEE